MKTRIITGGLVLSACLNSQIKEEQTMNISKPQNFEQFQQLLKTQEQQIEAPILQKAKQALNTLPKDEQQRALDYLSQQVQQFGSQEAKQWFSLNPELRLSEVISAFPADQVPAWTREQFEHNPLLNLDELKQLSPQQQTEMLSLVSKAQQYYADLAQGMRSGSNFATRNSSELAHFLEQAQQGQIQS